MEELIKVATNSQGEQVVSARELHNFLGAKSNHSTWFKNQSERAMLIENEDFVCVQISESDTKGGQNKIDYALKLSAAKEISMLNGGEKGKQARLYFLECEKVAKLSSVPQTYSQALLEAGRLAEQNERLLATNNNLSVKLDLLTDWVSIIKVAHRNKVKETAFNWRLLKSASVDLGYEIKKAESPRYGYQNLYHVNAFRFCYPKYDYNFNNSLIIK